METDSYRGKLFPQRPWFLADRSKRKKFLGPGHFILHIDIKKENSSSLKKKPPQHASLWQECSDCRQGQGRCDKQMVIWQGLLPSFLVKTGG